LTISNGSTVLSSDLLGMNTTALDTYQAWLSRDPDYFVLPVQFRNVLATTTEAYRTARVVLVDNYRLEDVLVQSNHAGTIEVSLDNGMLVAEVVIDDVFPGTSINKAPRYYSASGVSSLYRPLQILTKGSILDIVASTTDTGGGHNFNVALALTAPLRRF